MTSAYCVSCPFGTYNPHIGAKSSTDCRACPSALSNTGVALTFCPFAPTNAPSNAPITRGPTPVPTFPAPTSSPTSNPTVGVESQQTYVHATTLSTSDLRTGAGVAYIGEHTFNNMGLFYDKYYLSVYVYDTGFGPVSSGQYVTFTVNGNVLEVDSNELRCAPISEAVDPKSIPVANATGNSTGGVPGIPPKDEVATKNSMRVRSILT